MFSKLLARLFPPPRPADPPCTECRHAKPVNPGGEVSKCMRWMEPDGAYLYTGTRRVSWHCDGFEPLTCKAPDEKEEK